MKTNIRTQRRTPAPRVSNVALWRILTNTPPASPTERAEDEVARAFISKMREAFQEYP
jgi:hypothetical protein